MIEVSGASVQLSHQNAWLVLRAYPKNVACEVGVAVKSEEPSDAELLAREILTDLLLSVVPENVDIPRAVLYYAALDDTGKAAERELENWAAKKPVLDQIAPFPAGFPRVAKSEDFEDIHLAPGKKFLALAACPMDYAAEEALTGTLPRKVKALNVEQTTYVATNQPIACPFRELNAWIRPQGQSFDIGGGLHVGIVLNEFDEHRRGELHSKVAVFLFEAKTGKVLDALVKELRVPEAGKAFDGDGEAYPGLPIRACGSQVAISGTPYFTLGCKHCASQDSPDDRYGCQSYRTEGESYTVRAKNKKLVLERKTWMQ